MDVDIALALATAAAATVLICAGLGKLAVLRYASRAVEELSGLSSAALLIRTLCGVEVVAGVALVIPVTRPVGVLFTGALGIAFITLGVLARVKRAEASCGCFGRAEGHPFGLRNSLIGLALFVVAVVDGVSPDSRQSAEPGVALALTAAGCVCLSVWLHRKMIIVLLGPRVRISTSQEVEA